MRAFAAVVAFIVANSAFAATVTDPSLIVSNYLTGLSNPTAIRFSGPNQGFIIEQGGAVKRFQNGSVTTLLNLTVATDGGERGLLGLALDPSVASNGNGFVYLYHSAGTAGGAWVDNRLTRYAWNGTTLTSPLPMGTFGTSTDGQNDGDNHNGGPLSFGPDGKLYGVTGDLNRSGVEQNNKTTSASAFTGGVYRLNTDGTVPTDNPFTGAFNRWHSYGVRNSFGLAFDPATGRLWNTENGPNSFDEINLVPSGMNSGWTPIMGPDSRDPQNAPGALNMLIGAVYQDPKFSFEDPIGITSIQFLHGSAWGTGYNDAILVGENNNARLWLFRLNAARDGLVLVGDLADGVLDIGDASATFGTGFSVTTDIQVGPDGAVYVASLGGDRIYRIAPVPEPKVWLLSIAGLALVGGAVARQRSRGGS